MENNYFEKMAEARRQAPTYPSVYKEEVNDFFYISCWVAFVYRGVEYKRLHVESGILNGITTKEVLLKRFENRINLTQAKSTPCFLDVIVKVLDSDEQASRAWKYIEWLDKQIEWCERLFLCKENPDGITYRDIKIKKDTLDSASVIFFDIFQK